LRIGVAEWSEQATERRAAETQCRDLEPPPCELHTLHSHFLSRLADSRSSDQWRGLLIPRHRHVDLFISPPISERRGIAVAGPGLVTERAAPAEPKRAACIGSAPPASAAAKAPTNASPAPVVSTTSPAARAGT